MVEPLNWRAKCDRIPALSHRMGEAEFFPPLFSVTPTGYLSIPVEIDHPNFWPVAKIERNESFAHIKMVHPGFSVARSLDVVGLAVEADDLFFSHANLRVLVRLLLLRLRFGPAVGGRDRKSVV